MLRPKGSWRVFKALGVGRIGCHRDRTRIDGHFHIVDKAITCISTPFERQTVRRRGHIGQIDDALFHVAYIAVVAIV